MTRHKRTLTTCWYDKAGTTEFHIHLWLDNGHDVFSAHEELEPAGALEEAQAKAAAGLERLQRRIQLQGISATWWGDIQRGTWSAISHEDDGEVILDASWDTEGHPQWTSYPTDTGALAWEQLQ